MLQNDGISVAILKRHWENVKCILDLVRKKTCQQKCWEQNAYNEQFFCLWIPNLWFHQNLKKEENIFLWEYRKTQPYVTLPPTLRNFQRCITDVCYQYVTRYVLTCLTWLSDKGADVHCAWWREMWIKKNLSCNN